MKQFTIITFALILSSLTACSSQVEPAKKAENVEVKSSTEVSTKAETEAPATESKVTTAPVAGPSQVRGASQSTGTRATMYILKVAVSTVITYFVTKAIVDAVKDDVTSDD